MKLVCSPKPPFEEFIKTCTPLAIIDSFEAEMQARIETIAEAIMHYVPSGDPVENLAAFLKADKDFLGIALALANLSLQKFLRILSAERFARGDFGLEWSEKTVFKKFRNERGFAEQIARLLLEGQNNPLLTKHVAVFYLDQLSLSANWDQIVRDPQLVRNAIRHKLSGEYSDKKGDAIESIIRVRLDEIQSRYGIPHVKGQVGLVGGKEADHALPSLDDPFVVIMVCYMETTSSSQTLRANEHRKMFLAMQDNNLRHGVRRAFINFVDGAGWLARRSDLRKMYEGCDYVLNLNTLDCLEAIICKHVPDRYFTVSPKPQVEG